MTKKKWHPEYETDRGTKYVVEGVTSSECPVSLITPESRKLLELLSNNHTVAKGLGATMFGLDSSRWPARWFDAVCIFTNYLENEKRATQEAFHRDSQFR